MVCSICNEKFGIKQHKITCSKCNLIQVHRICLPPIAPSRYKEFKETWACQLCAVDDLTPKNMSLTTLTSDLCVNPDSTEEESKCDLNNTLHLSHITVKKGFKIGCYNANG